MFPILYPDHVDPTALSVMNITKLFGFVTLLLALYVGTVPGSQLRLTDVAPFEGVASL